MGKRYRQRHFHATIRDCEGKFDKTWNEWERYLITDPDPNRPNDAELARQLGRTVHSIHAERGRIKKRQQQNSI